MEKGTDIFYSSIIDKIVLQRKEMGLTQESFAKKIGLSRPTYVNIEQRRHRPTLYTLYNISTFTGKDMNYFFESIPQDKVEQSTVTRKIKNKLNSNEQETLLEFIRKIK
ncbi:helix-turn-helix domain-containing protein [Flammeovirga yaeyamensis]|uniref:Helix-turn-helix domain-containing protein n=1 Tax=Flammeovirga yaeyamensis TaxID=367791 RepID=A0AAX1N5G5_9BACT|nr:helix-turn-helix transcriptional regulator [Flammeovirga yaeyamensis]MBB3701252.1 transcriptional regulator with XRE-family HTH domain [Flammeovirga yaeyamensis]NMF38277.1 helix-turn-helix transcriptional regulator [Flammeovirga yaeyamensis]QWG02689.1 helix-turn-helix domain-containing protein [Flammeovirga yaeyamensis]